MSKTPKKDVKSFKASSGYSPLTLRQSPGVSSSQNLTGPLRIARDLVADLYNNIQHWNDSHIKGAGIVKQIGIIKSDDAKSYTPQLEEYTNELFNIVQILSTYKERFEQYSIQIKALAKLQKTSEALFISLDATSLADAVVTVANAYVEEFKVKKLVLENIAHSTNVNNAMFFAACWTHQINITRSINVKLESLLVETGFRQIN